MTAAKLDNVELFSDTCRLASSRVSLGCCIIHASVLLVIFINVFKRLLYDKNDLFVNVSGGSGVMPAFALLKSRNFGC